VTDGVYAWVQEDGSWWVSNAGAVATADGVVLIDTCATERRTRALLRAVDEATGGAPIAFAVNTHLHGDHAYGNSLLPESTVIIGHAATRAHLLTDPIIDGCPPFWDPVPDWGNVTRRPPTLTTETGMTLHSGGVRIELSHPGYPAHTPGDLVAWLPDQRVLFTGDLLFHQVTPLAFMGSLDGALRALDWIAAFEPAQVVPGHGPLIGAADLPGVLDAHRRYYQLVLDAASAGMREHRTPLEAARRCDLGPFAALPDAERIVLNLHRAYADADRDPDRDPATGADTDTDTGTGSASGEFDLIGALRDAMSFNGGPLRTIV